jgi:hypothetical protein
MDLNRPGLRFFVSHSTGSKLVSGRGGSRSPLRVRPMEEGRKSSLSYRPAALPKPFVPSDCASIGIIAAPLSESLLVKRWSNERYTVGSYATRDEPTLRLS